MTRLAGPLLSIAATGCFSFIGVRGAPAPCTDGVALPTMDAVLAAAGASIVVVSLATSRERGLLMNPLTGGLIALPESASALYGYTKVRGCRAAKAGDATRPRPSIPPPVVGASTPRVVEP